MNPLKKFIKSGSTALPAPAANPALTPASTPAAAPAAAPDGKAAREAPARPASGVEAKPSAAHGVPSITISHEAIAKAAYFRWQRFGGDQETNWHLAEKELRDEAARLGLLKV